MNMQKVDLYQPIEATRIGPAPIVLRTIVTTTSAYVAGGMPTEAKKSRGLCSYFFFTEGASREG